MLGPDIQYPGDRAGMSIGHFLSSARVAARRNAARIYVYVYRTPAYTDPSAVVFETSAKRPRRSPSACDVRRTVAVAGAAEAHAAAAAATVQRPPYRPTTFSTTFPADRLQKRTRENK